MKKIKCFFGFHKKSGWTVNDEHGIFYLCSCGKKMNEVPQFMSAAKSYYWYFFGKKKKV